MERERSKSFRSQAWQYFTRKPGRIATCKLCGNDFSYKSSVSNLTKHCMRKHGTVFSKENIESGDEDDSTYTTVTPERKYRRYFEITDTEDILRCKICSKEVLSESVGEHIAQDHGNEETDAESGTDTGHLRDVKEDAGSKNNSGKSPKPTRYRSNVWNYFTPRPGLMARCNLCKNDYSHRTSVTNLHKHCRRAHGLAVVVDTKYEPFDETSFTNERKFSTERYFDVTDNDQVLRCKLCCKDVHHETVADLIKHIVDKHGNFDDTDSEGETKAPKTKLLIWLYYKPCADTQTATCLICKASFSYQTSVSNLKQHLETDHPLVKFDGGGNNNRLLISADGDLYEVETESVMHHDGDQQQKDPIEMDTVYLEDYEDLPNKPFKKRPSFNRRNTKTPYKIKKNNSFGRYDEDSSFDRSKRSFKTKGVNIKREATIESSSEDELSTNKKLKDTRLDLFGQYIVSLLKEMPKRLSDQLQGDIIKHVITSKVNFESEKNKVTVTETIPGTETISVNESLPVIVCNSDGSIKNITNCQ